MRQWTPAPSAEAEAEPSPRQFVVFLLGEEPCALPMGAVAEIIRVPRLVPVPRAPSGLLGLANLRGSVVPVVDLRTLLGLPFREADEAARILIVRHRGLPAGLLVDRVHRVETVDDGRVEPATGSGAVFSPDALAGVIHAPNGQLVLLLDPEELLERRYHAAAADRAGGKPVARGTSRPRQPAREEAAGATTTDLLQFVTFRVAGEEYGIDIRDVQEIVRVPEQVRAIPGTPAHVLGLVDLRGRSLPLVTLRGLFSLPEKRLDESARVLVLRPEEAGGALPSVGVVVDDVHEVLAIPPRDVEPTPPLLARTEGMAEIGGLCRPGGGTRLVGLVDARRLLSGTGVRAAIEAARSEGGDQVNQADDTTVAGGEGDDLQFVVFQLAGEEYCAPIERVQEIIRVPDRMNQVPGGPEFVAGLINLRGTVLPVLDLRRRFGLDPLEDRDRQRIVVTDIGGKRTGLIVDAVSEVLRIRADILEPAPARSGTAIEAVRDVANLAEEGRLLFVLDMGWIQDVRVRETPDRASATHPTEQETAAAAEEVVEA